MTKKGSQLCSFIPKDDKNYSYSCILIKDWSSHCITKTIISETFRTENMFFLELKFLTFYRPSISFKSCSCCSAFFSNLRNFTLFLDFQNSYLDFQAFFTFARAYSLKSFKLFFISNGANRIYF